MSSSTYSSFGCFTASSSPLADEEEELTRNLESIQLQLTVATREARRTLRNTTEAIELPSKETRKIERRVGKLEAKGWTFRNPYSSMIAADRELIQQAAPQARNNLEEAVNWQTRFEEATEFHQALQANYFELCQLQEGAERMKQVWQRARHVEKELREIIHTALV